jgi:hypothetical protein
VRIPFDGKCFDVPVPFGVTAGGAFEVGSNVALA